MTVAYHLVIIIAIALVVRLGVKYTDYEEYFVTLGVLDIIYLICVFFYIVSCSGEVTINF